jgi:hypothetical protein
MVEGHGEESHSPHGDQGAERDKVEGAGVPAAPSKAHYYMTNFLQLGPIFHHLSMMPPAGAQSLAHESFGDIPGISDNKYK